MSDSLGKRKNKVRSEAKKEQNEVLVVPVAQTVVDERAVVVEVFHATTANLTMKVGLSFYHFVIWAKVV